MEISQTVKFEMGGAREATRGVQEPQEGTVNRWGMSETSTKENMEGGIADN